MRCDRSVTQNLIGGENDKTVVHVNVAWIPLVSQPNETFALPPFFTCRRRFSIRPANPQRDPTKTPLLDLTTIDFDSQYEANCHRHQRPGVLKIPSTCLELLRWITFGRSWWTDCIGVNALYQPENDSRNLNISKFSSSKVNLKKTDQKISLTGQKN